LKCQENKFERGGVIPIMFGAFGETTKLTKRSIKNTQNKLAIKVESTEFSPLVEDN